MRIASVVEGVASVGGVVEGAASVGGVVEGVAIVEGVANKTHRSSCKANEGNFALQAMTGECNGREHIAQLLLHVHTQLQLAEVSRRL